MSYGKWVKKQPWKTEFWKTGKDFTHKPQFIFSFSDFTHSLITHNPILLFFYAAALGRWLRTWIVPCFSVRHSGGIHSAAIIWYRTPGKSLTRPPGLNNRVFLKIMPYTRKKTNIYDVTSIPFLISTRTFLKSGVRFFWRCRIHTSADTSLLSVKI